MSASSDETIPQIALFIQESSVRPPPPPPPRVVSSPAPRTLARAPRPMVVPMQHLPPPPPPPPPAVPSTSTSQLHNIVHHGLSPQPSTSFAICHPSRAVPMFDARRPPPPIHTHAQPNNNIFKRPMSNCCTAAPSKLRKTEEPKPDEALCDVCVQREISIESYRIKMLQISSEDECQTLLLKKKQNEYLRQKDVLRSLVDSNMFRKIEQFVEDVPQYNLQSVLNNLNDSFRTGLTSSIPNQMLLQFMDFFFSDSSKFESSQSVRVEDSLRQTLSEMSRSPVRRSSPDFLLKLQDMLCNEDRTSSSGRPAYGEPSVECAHSPGANGVSNYHRYSNGQRAPPPPAPAAVAPPAPPPPLPTAYSHYPPPRAYYPPPYLPPAHRATTSRAPVPPCPPYAVERFPSPYYYYQ